MSTIKRGENDEVIIDGRSVDPRAWLAGLNAAKEEKFAGERMGNQVNEYDIHGERLKTDRRIEPNYDDGHGKAGGREDGNKPRVDLLPPDALLAVSEVLGDGAIKYAPRNWEKGMAWSRVMGSLLRHTLKRMMGEVCDPETGRLHSAHIATNALFLLTYELRGIGKDDLT